MPMCPDCREVLFDDAPHSCIARSPLTESEVLERLRELYAPDALQSGAIDFPEELQPLMDYVIRRTRETRKLLGVPIPDEARLTTYLETRLSQGHDT